MSEATKFLLPEDAIPTHWVNLLPDLPGEPLPPLSARTGQPAGPDDLTPIFPMGLIMQEVASEPEVEIPEEVRQAYGLWRRGDSEEESTAGAIRLYKYSISYLTLLFAAIAIDALVMSAVG